MRIATRPYPSLLALAAASALLLGACSTAAAPSATPVPASAVPAESHMDDGHDEEFHFGMPADAADADRTIEIAAADIVFEPDSLTITVGETITFTVTNTGALPHDFLIGTSEMQDEHDAEMAEGMTGMHEEPNAFVLAAGETKSLTWTFTEAGELLFGCHQIGHYAAGMVGTITVVE